MYNDLRCLEYIRLTH